MIILGLDPGIARTGYGLIEAAGAPTLLRCGCLTTPPGGDIADRLVTLGQDLATLLTQIKPEQAVVESIFFGANSTTAMATAQARGVLLYILRRHHIPIQALTPLQIKSRLTGSGRATKHQMQRVVMQRLHLSIAPSPDDAADALAAALSYT